MMRWFLLAAVLLLPSVPSAQDYGSGNGMHAPCKHAVDQRPYRDPDTTYLRGSCMGQIGTLFYFSEVLPEKLKFCTPQGANVGQAAKIVVAYMDANPRELHEEFLLLAGAALHKAWPC